jgi:hypothetical protein
MTVYNRLIQCLNRVPNDQAVPPNRAARGGVLYQICKTYSRVRQGEYVLFSKIAKKPLDFLHNSLRGTNPGLPGTKNE